MLAENRHKIIYEHVQNLGAVTVSELVKEFGVSLETIRRDLLLMEREGLLKRVHGGAVGISDMRRSGTLKERNKEYSEEKKILSYNAARFISNGDIIFIDSGSTAIAFSSVLKEKFSDLTIITHSLDVFNMLCNYKDFKLILCGGHFQKEENAFYGSLVLETMEKLHAQKAFLFPSAVSVDFGICDYDESLCQIQKQMIKCADRIFILADSSKFEKKALIKLDDMKKEYFYITDDKLSKGIEQLYSENEINICKGVTNK